MTGPSTPPPPPGPKAGPNVQVVYQTVPPPPVGPADIAQVLYKARYALSYAQRRCPYHDVNFGKNGWLAGEPNCDSCKQPWRVATAMQDIEFLLDRVTSNA